jgi:hypothetical protein
METLSTRADRRKRNPHSLPESGGPRRGPLTTRERPATTAAQISIYSGQDRLGSYRRVGAVFEAFDRLGRALGTFPNEREAIASIDPEASEISDRTARLYMQVAKNRATIEEQIGNDVADLTLTEAAALIAMSSNIEKLFKFLRDIKHVDDPEQIVQMAIGAGVIGVIKDNDYDPFHHVDKDRIVDWHLFALWLVECQNAEVVGAGYHTEYLLQQQFKTPDEWMGDKGDQRRKAWRYRNPEMPAGTKQQWAAFLAEHRGWSAEDIKRRVEAIERERDAARAPARTRSTSRRLREAT